MIHTTVYRLKHKGDEMKFQDGVSFGAAQAYVNKMEAYWREDYMKSGLYMDMSFEEYCDNMAITEYRDGIKKALNDLMMSEKGSAA